MKLKMFLDSEARFHTSPLAIYICNNGYVIKTSDNLVSFVFKTKEDLKDVLKELRQQGYRIKDDVDNIWQLINRS